jgi:hypothetical protein
MMEVLREDGVNGQGLKTCRMYDNDNDDDIDDVEKLRSIQLANLFYSMTIIKLEHNFLSFPTSPPS